MNITISESSLINIINEYCSCGGRGPNDNPCDACSIWHTINRVATKAKQGNPLDFIYCSGMSENG